MALTPVRVTELTAATALTPATVTYVVVAGTSRSTTLDELGEFLTATLVARLSSAEADVTDFEARVAEINSVLGAKQNKTDTLDASRLTGTIDLARLPVLPGTAQVVSGGGLVALTAEQQAEITKGAIVTTTDGDRFVYRGTGSKTSEASYILLADIAPDWSAISDKPILFPPDAHGHAWGEITGKPTTFPPAVHGHAWGEITGKPTSFEPTAHAHAVATQTTAGFMSASDKLRLDSLTGGDEPEAGGSGKPQLGSIVWTAAGIAIPADRIPLTAIYQNASAVDWPALGALFPKYLAPHLGRRAVTKVRPTGTAASDAFGTRVAISADGNTFVASSPNTDIGASNSGSAYVFTRTAKGQPWTQQGILRHPAPASTDQAGLNGLAISGDGNVVALGVHLDDLAAGSDAGTVLIFRRNNGVWTQTAQIGSAEAGVNAASNDQFGFSVALSFDGRQLVIGLPGRLSGAAVYTFSTTDFVTWTYRYVSNPTDAVNYNRFGHAIGMSDDGLLMIVGATGAPGGTAGTTTNSGAIYRYTRASTTVDWTSEGKVNTPVALLADNLFGSAIAVARDGQSYVVGAPVRATTSTGAGTVFYWRKVNGTWTSTWFASIVPAQNDNFGSVVAIDTDGDFFVAGTPNNDDKGLNAGRVEPIGRRLNDAFYNLRGTLVGEDTTAGDGFGSSVALSGDSSTLVIGAPKKDGSAGNVYVMDFPLEDHFDLGLHPLQPVGAAAVAQSPASLQAA